jgi:predicted Zn-dependent protease
MALARLQLLRDQPDLAIETLERVRARFPREPYVNGLLARAWAMRGDPARAEEHLRAESEAGATSIRDPWQAEVQRHELGLLARLGRAKARVAAGDASGAWEELAPLAARSDELVVLDAQCQVLLALGRPEEVLARLERAPPEVAASSMLVTDRVLALRATGRTPAAAELMAAEVARNPAQCESHALLGELLFELERPADAVAAFEAARARGDATLSPAPPLGRARAASGDLAGGLRELAHAAESHPRAPKPWAYRCELLALEGRAVEALESLEEARRRGLEPELVERVAARIDELVGPDGARVDEGGRAR